MTDRNSPPKQISKPDEGRKVLIEIAYPEMAIDSHCPGSSEARSGMGGSCERMAQAVETDGPITPDFAAGFERGLIEQVLKEVEELTEGRTDPFWAGVSQAVEETRTRLEEAWERLPLETSGLKPPSNCTCPYESRLTSLVIDPVCPEHGSSEKASGEQT